MIEPATPDVVYVPAYDPNVVYGPWPYPYYPPYYWPPYSYYYPGYYPGYAFGAGMFWAQSFAGAMDRFSTIATQSLSAPTPGSSGGSGFGGGGFSGGGVGGGGGGGW